MHTPGATAADAVAATKGSPSRSPSTCALPGKKRYYLALSNDSQGNYSSNVAFFFVYLVTYWLLFSYLVPISLFVTIEIVKFVQVPFSTNMCCRLHCSVWRSC